MKLGTTLFSFTNEWLARRYTLAELLRRTSALDLGPAVEVIGYQAWRDYPALPRDAVLEFRRLCDELGLEPAALGGYVDLARRVDRLVTLDEAVALLRSQIDVAARLGFPVLRLHAGIPVDALERVAPLAERRGVTLATEVQGSQAPDHPVVAEILACRERVGSPSIALALDYSVAMAAVPRTFADALRRLGMSASDLDGLIGLWQSGASTAELFAAIGDVDAPAAALDEARSGFVRFGRQDPRAWLPLVPEIAYAHAKFWELGDDGDDPSVRTAELFEVLVEGGYDGAVASEWGGSAWKDVDDVNGFEIVGRHQALCRRLIGDAAAPGADHTNVLSLASEGNG
jgi:Xylose isomerase-like TIM barrel